MAYHRCIIGNSGGGYTHGQLAYGTSGTTSFVNCGFRPKVITIIITNSTGFLFYAYDENVSTAMVFSGENVTPNAAKQTIGGTNVRLQEVSATGFTLYYAASGITPAGSSIYWTAST